MMGMVPERRCCWETYVGDAVVDHVNALIDSIPKSLHLSVERQEDIKQRMVERVLQMVSVHPLFKNKLVIDVIPERHRPYHEQLAQAIQDGLHGEANTPPVVRREFHGDEGSGRSATAPSGAGGPIVDHDNATDHEDSEVRRQAAIEEKNRGPQAQVGIPQAYRFLENKD